MNEQNDKFEMNCIPEDISNAASEACLQILLEKSKARYEKTYLNFQHWCNSKATNIINETILLAYMHKKSKIYKACSLWSQYSMLKTSTSFCSC